MAGKAILKAIPLYCGNSKPTKLKTTRAKPSIVQIGERGPGQTSVCIGDRANSSLNYFGGIQYYFAHDRERRNIENT